MSELIKEETVTEEITKEEKVLNLFTQIDNKHLQKKAALLYKYELYDKSVVEKFNEDLYKDVTYNNGYKGYALFKDSEDNLLMVKELSAEAGEESYAFEVLTLANLSDEEMCKLHHYAHRHPITLYVLSGLAAFGLLLGVIVFFVAFFDSLSSGFIVSLTYAYFYAGGYITVTLGILTLIVKSLLKPRGPRK